MYKYLIMLLLLWNTAGVHAQLPQSFDPESAAQAIRPQGRYALLVQTAPHLKAAIKTGAQLKARSAAIELQIVVCGALVQALSQNPELQQLLEQARQQGTPVLLCGMSMQQFGVARSSLPASTLITENGLIYLFGLQEQGYQTITL